MAKIRDFMTVPPGGWRYVQPETAAQFAADDFDTLVADVRRHREYKGLPVENVSKDIQDQICLSLGPSHCRPYPGEEYKPIEDMTSRLTIGMVTSISKALALHVINGCEFVPKEEADRRAKICAGCPFNKPATLCSCSKAYSVIEALIPSDRKNSSVSVCMVCGCSLQAKINLPMEIIQKVLPPGIVLPDWCWQGAHP